MKKNKGITLIALVVTIVVLLILAGTSIAMLSGDNGIITRAKQAKEETDKAEEDEKKSLNNVENIINEKTGFDISKDLEENPSKYKHPDQSTDNKDIAIGTDNQPVDLDLWKYGLTYDGTGVWLGREIMSSSSESGYSNENITSDGKIIGKVPKFIYIEAIGKVMPVISMIETFYECTNLLEAPEIPDTVTNMSWTFDGCINLVKAPEIPEKVTYMEATFNNCKNLTGTVTINAKSLEYYYDCFYNTVKPIILKGSSQNLQEIAETANNGNVTVGE